MLERAADAGEVVAQNALGRVVYRLGVGAAHDRVTPAAGVRRVAQYYGAGAAYREYAAHGHWIVDEPGAAEVARDIADWLASI